MFMNFVPNLFRLAPITLHSGKASQWKIDCDALTDADWDCLAHIGMELMGWPQFYGVIGIPVGGIKLAQKLEQYAVNDGDLLIVDDVLTTGGSMMSMQKQYPEARGLVVFARGPCSAWITPIFQMGSML